MALEITHFKLNRAVLELRFQEAFLLWDRAGRIWQTLRRTFPDVKLNSAKPNAQQILVQKNIVSEVQFDRMNVQGVSLNGDLDVFNGVSDRVCREVLTVLEITDLSRIGLRLFFEKDFDSKVSATDYAAGLLPHLARSGKYFNIEANKISDVEQMTRWEGTNTGCLVRFQSIEQTLEMEVPSGFPEDQFPKSPQKRYFVCIDVDYYVHASTPVSKFSPKALIESWSHIVRRDVGSFLDV